MAKKLQANNAKANKKLRQHNSITGVQFKQGWTDETLLGLSLDFILKDEKVAASFIRKLQKQANTENTEISLVPND